jgi:hypothetical protein
MRKTSKQERPVEPSNFKTSVNKNKLRMPNSSRLYKKTSSARDRLSRIVERKPSGGKL